MALHEIWPEAPLYTSVYDKKRTPWADAFEVRTSFLQKLPLPKSKHEYYPFLMGPAFETFNFDEFDIVISVTHEFSKAIITKSGTRHICYCLNPVSYLWSGHDDYFSGKPDWFKDLTQPMINYLRLYDKVICRRPDKYIAISKVVKERIKKYYGLNSDVIYPPVVLKDVVLSRQDHVLRSDFFLVVSRLVPNKRVDLAVKAFNELGWPIKIVGVGSQEEKLKGMAKKNIEFLGQLTDAELARYYESCRALIEPGEVDFGLVALEAQSYGKPVVAYGAGGSRETVIPSKTGFFFSAPTAKSLVETISEVNLDKIDPNDCATNAAKFSKERFKKEFLDYVRHS